jgi:hypothetical protein
MLLASKIGLWRRRSFVHGCFAGQAGGTDRLNLTFDPDHLFNQAPEIAETAD